MSRKYQSRSEKIQTSLKDFALYCSIKRALQPAALFNSGGPGIMVLVVPEAMTVFAYVTATSSLLFNDEDYSGQADVGFMCVSPQDKPEKVVASFEGECRDKKRAIVLTWSAEALPPTVQLSIDHTFEVKPISIEDLQSACDAVLEMSLTDEQAAELLKFPLEHVASALRVGRSVDETLFRLASVASELETNAPTTPKANEVVLRLEDMHGYGSAKEWGMQLACDLGDWRDGKIAWSDVDTGLLLSGPPGTGKTIFARALAETCGTHLVATSLGQWQAAGHLGDLLKAMRRDFASARAATPSILFIDELDSIGDRNTFSHDNASYSIQVVNALLECIDGIGGREGVIIIGATNAPDRIDPAVRRAGRLDKHVVIPMPNAEDRVAILLQQLGMSWDTGETGELGMLTEGMTGADLAQLARGARRVARKGKRDVGMEDIRANLPELLSVTGFYRRSVAVHEAGHAIVGSELKFGTLLGIGIANKINPRIRVQSAGGAAFRTEQLCFRDRQAYLDQICVFLAGIAAEQIELRTRGDGAGAGPGSDLARATTAALFMETQAGLGDCLVYSPAETAEAEVAILRSDQQLKKRIDAILQEEFSRAKSLLNARRPLLKLIYEELDERGFVSAERFSELKRKSEPKQRQTD